MEAARGKTVDNLPQMGEIPSFQNNIDFRLFGSNIVKYTLVVNLEDISTDLANVLSDLVADARLV